MNTLLFVRIRTCSGRPFQRAGQFINAKVYSFSFCHSSIYFSLFCKY
uniref:Uncharacterized protein n=1 Tax=Anguilla anguilla TaxID=7936 RepID=A0A0E9T3B7_ANGAN